MNRNRESVMELTPNEETVLVMFRGGMKHREIAAALNISAKGGIAAVSRAAEKERLMILSKAEKRGPGAANTVAKAKGRKGMITDVRKGAWK